MFLAPVRKTLQQEIWRPPANYNNICAIALQSVHHFEQERQTDVDFFPLVCDQCQYLNRCSRSAVACSSPRPLKWIKSR